MWPVRWTSPPEISAKIKTPVDKKLMKSTVDGLVQNVKKLRFLVKNHVISMVCCTTKQAWI
jgi:hypothetical protein